MKLLPFLLVLPALFHAPGGCARSVQGEPPTAEAPRFDKVFELKPSEGVFAYSRISPDGKTLAYASEMTINGRFTTTVTVVELATKKVLFSDPGIDAYFSNDNKRMIYLSQGGRGGSSVVIRHMETGATTRDVASTGLGDYFSWAVRDGRNMIMTIASNYYYLDGDKGVMPSGHVTSCPGIGAGERPLVSKDGRRVSTFVRGNVMVRGIDNCNDIFDTGMQGGKTDFSFDNRYVAMHTQKENGRGYDIAVVDLRERTVRNITASLAGSSLFPSWTLDGRLSFRYDGEDYRGFMFASDVLTAPAKPLPAAGSRLAGVSRDWENIFPETARPPHRLNLVLVWGTWSAHMPDALRDLQRAQAWFQSNGMDVSVSMATDPGSLESDIVQTLARHRIDLPRIPLAPERLTLTEMNNQNPTMLLFRDGRLVDRRLGPQTFAGITEWSEGYRPSGASVETGEK